MNEYTNKYDVYSFCCQVIRKLFLLQERQYLLLDMVEYRHTQQ